MAPQEAAEAAAFRARRSASLAAAGGALVAVNALRGGGEEASGVSTTYRGSFSVQSVYNSTTTTNGVLTGHCTNQAVVITGNITVTLDERGAGDIEWTADILRRARR